MLSFLFLQVFHCINKEFLLVIHDLAWRKFVMSFEILKEILNCNLGNRAVGKIRDSVVP